jgi:DNA-binding XRE family transcriptional regulator
MNPQDLEIMNGVVTRINMLRYNLGYSIKELAEFSDIPESTIKSILSRKTCPRITTLFKICNALNISICDFFKYEGSKDCDSASIANKICLLTPNQKQALLNVVDVFMEGNK